MPLIVDHNGKIIPGLGQVTEATETPTETPTDEHVVHEALTYLKDGISRLSASEDPPDGWKDRVNAAIDKDAKATSAWRVWDSTAPDSYAEVSVPSRAPVAWRAAIEIAVRDHLVAIRNDTFEMNARRVGETVRISKIVHVDHTGRVHWE